MAIRTRCPTIDGLTGGGFAIGQLSEVCGELCLQAVATAVADTKAGGLGGSAIYISYQSSFPIQRFHQLLSVMQPENQQRPMERVISMAGAGPYDLIEILNNIKDKLKSDNGSSMNLKLIVIDSLYGFVTHHSTNNEEGTFERGIVVRSLGYGLKCMARDYNIAIVACNMAVDLYDNMLINAFRTSGRFVKPGIGTNWERYLYIRYVMTHLAVEGQEGWSKMFGIFNKGEYYGHCAYSLAQEGVMGDA